MKTFFQKNYRIFFICSILICTVASIFFISRLKPKEVILDEVKLVNNIDRNMFAIMLEQKDASGNSTYVEDKNRTSWPTDGYAYNSIKSGCIDSDGNKIEDTEEEKVLTFDGEKVTIRTNKTVYCYLYFDLNEAPRIPEDGVTVKNKTTTTIEVEVNATKGTGNIIKYYYKAGENGREEYKLVSNGDANKYTFTGLQAGTKYKLFIYVEDDKGNKSSQSFYYEAMTSTAGDVVFIESSKGSNGLNLSPLGGMYRFQGTKAANEVNNYICFGTTNSATCKGSPEKYMYRIIGIVAEDDDNLGIEAGDIKVIKKTKVGNQQWYSSYDYDEDSSVANITWDKSYIFQKLNGKDSSNLFIGTGTSYTYMNESTWYNLIRDVSWYQGDLGYEYGNIEAEAMYKIETGKTKEGTSDGIATWVNTSGGKSTGAWEPITVSGTYATYRTVSGKTIQTAKIGLMYLHDYYWSSTKTTNCYYNSDTYTDCLNGWMHIANNGTSEYEWIMSRIGRYNVDYTNFHMAWIVTPEGKADYYNVTGEYALRPVFYLKSTTNISYNTNDNENTPGSAGNPYVITFPTS